MGRPVKPDSKCTRNAGLCGYPVEISALRSVAKAMGYRTGFDLIRHLMRHIKHPAALGRFEEPRLKSER